MLPVVTDLAAVQGAIHGVVRIERPTEPHIALGITGHKTSVAANVEARPRKGLFHRSGATRHAVGVGGWSSEHEPQRAPHTPTKPTEPSRL